MTIKMSPNYLKLEKSETHFKLKLHCKTHYGIILNSDGILQYWYNNILQSNEIIRNVLKTVFAYCDHNY